jgi:hypothetical protein
MNPSAKIDFIKNPVYDEDKLIKMLLSVDYDILFEMACSNKLILRSNNIIHFSPNDGWYYCWPDDFNNVQSIHKHEYGSGWYYYYGFCKHETKEKLIDYVKKNYSISKLICDIIIKNKKNLKILQDVEQRNNVLHHKKQKILSIIS